MKLVCVKCKTELRPKTNGAYVIEYAAFGPYKFWRADLRACPGCDVEIVGVFASRPIAEHYQPNFDEEIAKARKHGGRIIEDYERAQV